MKMPYDFESAVAELESCGFECQAGPLSNSLAWQWIKGQEDHLPIDARQALMAGHDEIVRLRRQVADLEPKARAYDTIEQIARLSMPELAQGFAEDPAWRMKAIIEKDAEKRKKERETNA